MLKLLLVEDEKALAETIALGLEAEGYVVELAADGTAGETRAREGRHDVLIVDWMLPGQDGRTLVERLRNDGVTTPILMLTALDEPARTVAALDAGADDYLTKPFSFDELYARLRALVRRTEHPAPLRAGRLRLDPHAQTVHFGDEPLDLRPKEFFLLRLLLLHPDAVVEREMLAERVWGTRFTSDDAINMTVSSLRRKLRDADDARRIRIETVRGVGYRLRVPS